MEVGFVGGRGDGDGDGDEAEERRGKGGQVNFWVWWVGAWMSR